MRQCDDQGALSWGNPKLKPSMRQLESAQLSAKESWVCLSGVPSTQKLCTWKTPWISLFLAPCAIAQLMHTGELKSCILGKNTFCIYETVAKIEFLTLWMVISWCMCSEGGGKFSFHTSIQTAFEDWMERESILRGENSRTACHPPRSKMRCKFQGFWSWLANIPRD